MHGPVVETQSVQVVQSEAGLLVGEAELLGDDLHEVAAARSRARGRGGSERLATTISRVSGRCSTKNARLSSISGLVTRW